MVRTRCPKCDTRYDIDPEALLEADGLACCYRCGTVFDIVAEDAPTQEIHSTLPGSTPLPLAEKTELPVSADDADDQPRPSPSTEGEAVQFQPPTPAEEADGQDEPAVSVHDADEQSELSTPAIDPDSLSVLLKVTDAPEAQTGLPAAGPEQDGQFDPTESAPGADALPEPQADSGELPFAVPDDLEPLKPSPDVALDVVDTLYEKRSRRGFYYGLATALLVVGLGLQLAWQHREDLLNQFPTLQPLCERIECLPSVVRQPDKFSVVQRDIKPTPNTTDSLTLTAKIRNDAETAQHFPDMQLSLLDTSGSVLVRRRLTPGDYLFPAPPKDKVVNPGEVVTITLDFKDPGYKATGFAIGFL